MASPDDPHNAFIDRALRVAGAGSGPLQGMTVAVKDLFDVAGHRTGFGNPCWRETHGPAGAHAPAVQALLSAGASVAGKAHMDELAYSLNGENCHYGTPRNPAAPGRVPGGSSSGSAVAVACGAVDVGLGSDTAGSVRVPASYCGVYGMRPTWGRASLEGARPLAPSYDACGWFTRSAELLARVGSVLLLDAQGPRPGQLCRWLVSTDAFDLADDAARTAIYSALQPHTAEVRQLLGGGPPQEVQVGSVEGGLGGWVDVFRVSQAAEVWACHGEWVTRERPQFAPDVAERFVMASQVTPEQADAACARRELIRQHVWALLGDDAVLMLPSAPGPAPLLRTPPAELNAFRARLISLSALASLCQLPQVSLPLATVHGCPVGLSLIGPPGSDEALLDTAQRLAAVLGLP